MYQPPELRTWIAGEPEDSAVTDGFSLHDPNDGRPVQASRSSSPGQVERALVEAQRVHVDGTWQSSGVAERGTRLEHFADQLEDRVEDLAVLDAVNSGVPVSVTRMFAGSLAGTVRRAAELAAELGDHVDLSAPQGPVRLRRVAWGPTALLVPWNAPAAIAIKKMAYALAMGAPVVVKPSPFSPWSAQAIAESAAAAFPPGVVSVVLGGAQVGAQLCADPRVRAVSMTGSSATGRAVAVASAPHLTRLQLELGSTNPVVVRADADVEATARSLYSGMTKLNGQWCEAPRAVFADAQVHADLLDALASLVTEARLGSSLDDSTMVGPMAFQARQSELAAQCGRLLDGGGRLVASARTPQAGWFVGPTVIDGRSPDPGTEMFGPVLTVESVPNTLSAVERADAIAGGLAAYVFGGDVEEAIRVGSRLTAGEVKVNGTSVLDMAEDSAQSFFGSSGIGGHGDRDLLDFYAGKQVVGADLPDAPI